jgi:hypothetical protein
VGFTYPMIYLFIYFKKKLLKLYKNYIEDINILYLKIKSKK